MRILGFNILTDKELNKIKTDFKSALAELFDKKDVYIVERDSELLPKCEFCDDDRRVEVELPDGTKTKVSCSCNKVIKKTKIVKVEDNYIWKYKDGDVFLTFKNIYGETYMRKLIVNLEQLRQEMVFTDFYYFKDYMFISPELAQQALDWHEAIYEERQKRCEQIRLNAEKK